MELAQEAGVVRSVIHYWAKRLGKKPPVRRTTRNHVALVHKAKQWNWKAGASALAREHNVSRTWVYHLGRKLKKL